jgi:DNA-binding transcriptional LysR family regulator
MDTIEALRTSVRVVETGSLTAVAREMNTSQSTISRYINQLEDHFGCGCRTGRPAISV